MVFSSTVHDELILLDIPVSAFSLETVHFFNLQYSVGTFLLIAVDLNFFIFLFSYYALNFQRFCFLSNLRGCLILLLGILAEIFEGSQKDVGAQLLVKVSKVNVGLLIPISPFESLSLINIHDWRHN